MNDMNDDILYALQDPQVRKAYDRAEQAYAAARAVYDEHPRGLPPREALSERDRALVDDHARADSAVKRLRALYRAKPSAS